MSNFDRSDGVAHLAGRIDLAEAVRILAGVAAAVRSLVAAVLDLLETISSILGGIRVETKLTLRRLTVLAGLSLLTVLSVLALSGGSA